MPIIWDINPTIINIGFFELRYYSIFFALGLFFAYFVFYKINKEDKNKYVYSKKQLEDLVFFLILGIIIGARLGHCLFYDFTYYMNHITEIFLPFTVNKQHEFVFTGYQGLASHGAGIGILTAVLLFCRKYKQNILSLLDRICIVVPLAGGFIRLGNFMNSEIIGKATGSSFGFIFKRIDNIPRHPTQLYEALFYFLIFFILKYIYKNTKFIENKGKIFGIFLMLLFFFRFFIEFLKENQSGFENNMILNMGQILSLPFIIIGFILFLRERFKNI